MRWLIAFVVVLVAIRVVDADLENNNQLFTSRADRLRLVVPRGWRASDQPSYPGVLLWMVRSDPEEVHMVMTAQAFTREVYCSWPITCRTQRDTTLPAKAACALGQKLAGQRMRVGQVQAGPKDNEEAGLPSVWIEYDDGKRYFRHALAVGEDRVVSLVLSAPTIESRTSHVRAFEQALRTLRPLTAEELGQRGIAVQQQQQQVVPTDAGIDGGELIDAATGAAAGSASFESAPAPKINPVGSCAS